MGSTCQAPIVVISLAVTPSMIPVPAGTDIQAYCTATLPNGTTMDVTNVATWMSRNPQVASVDGRGRIHAIAVGMADVACSYGGKTAMASVVVK